jgi:hypothetical protein
MSKTINQLIDDLPTKNLTTRVLGALDWVVPGHYTNLVGFVNTIKTISGEDDEKLIQKIGERAIALYNDKSQGYQRALWLYQKVDTLQGMAGFAVLMSKVGDNINFLSFMKHLTPKPETTQCIDLGVKLIVELLAFTTLNGIPGDSFADFVKSLSDYHDESLMRMGAIICLDGILPLGPDFLSKGLSMLEKAGGGELAKSERFQQVQEYIPGSAVGEKLSFLQKGTGAIKDWIRSFVAARDLNLDKVVGNMKGFLDGIGSKLDYVSAFLDMTTNYVEHTGTQTVARSLVTRAISEI